MADLLLDTQGTPAAPAAGKLDIYPDSSTNRLTTCDSNGRKLSLDGVIRNWNTADVVANAADTYLTGSGLVIPQHLLQAGATFKWRFGMTKTAAGVAAPVWTIRAGTLGTIADAAILTLTSGSAQTAAVDAGVVDISCVLRNTGAAGILAAILMMNHNGITTGFAAIAQVVLQATGAGFNTTTAGLIIGVSVNPGASGVWTHQVIAAEMSNM